MLMYDCLKKEMKSKLIFQFIKNIQRPQYIEILKFKKEISPNADEIEIDFVDSSINDYKVYDDVIFICKMFVVAHLKDVATNAISITAFGAARKSLNLKTRRNEFGNQP